MPFTLIKINYDSLNARQKENYNFLKISAVLAEYGFITLRLSDDWQGADFIAQHIDGTFLKVQLKARLSFDAKYRGKDLYIVFCFKNEWYLYPHDELLTKVLASTTIGTSDSWMVKGGYSYPGLSEAMTKMLQPYKIGPMFGLPTNL